jgi:hypothetical protein
MTFFVADPAFVMLDKTGEGTHTTAIFCYPGGSTREFS